MSTISEFVVTGSYKQKQAMYQIARY